MLDNTSGLCKDEAMSDGACCLVLNSRHGACYLFFVTFDEIVVILIITSVRDRVGPWVVALDVQVGLAEQGPLRRWCGQKADFWKTSAVRRLGEYFFRRGAKQRNLAKSPLPLPPLLPLPHTHPPTHHCSVSKVSEFGRDEAITGFAFQLSSDPMLSSSLVDVRHSGRVPLQDVPAVSRRP